MACYVIPPNVANQRIMKRKRCTIVCSLCPHRYIHDLDDLDQERNNLSPYFDEFDSDLDGLDLSDLDPKLDNI